MTEILEGVRINKNTIDEKLEGVPNGSGRDKSDSDEFQFKSESVGHHANHGHSIHS